METNLVRGRLFSLDIFFGRVLNKNKVRNARYTHERTTHENRSFNLWVRRGLNGGDNLGLLVLGLGNGGGGSCWLRHYALDSCLTRGRNGMIGRDLHVCELKTKRERDTAEDRQIEENKEENHLGSGERDG